MNASEKFPVLLDGARRAPHPMASRDHNGDGAPDPPRRPPLPSPPPPSPPSPDRTPEPMRDPPHPEHPDPVREPPSDRPPRAVTSAGIEARHLPRLSAFPNPHLPLSTLRPHPYECVRMTRGRRSRISAQSPAASCSRYECIYWMRRHERPLRGANWKPSLLQRATTRLAVWWRPIARCNFYCRRLPRLVQKRKSNGKPRVRTQRRLRDNVVAVLARRSLSADFTPVSLMQLYAELFCGSKYS